MTGATADSGSSGGTSTHVESTGAQSGSGMVSMTPDGTTGLSDSGTTTTGDSTSSSDSGADSDSDSGDGGDHRGTGGTEGSCYDPKLYPYAGLLCGPPRRPCAVLTDEVIDGTPLHRNGVPSIVLDNDCAPQVLYSFAVGGFHGHLACRTGADTWAKAPTPFEHNQGGAAFEPATGHTLVASHNAAWQVQAWRFDGTWTLEDTLPGDHGLQSQGVTQTGDGSLYIATEHEGLTYSWWDGSWTSQLLAPEASRPMIGLGPSTSPHLGYWATGAQGWEMWWATPGQTPELVALYGSAGLNLTVESIEVIDDGGDGIPHMLFPTRLPGSSELLEIMHATRTGPASWELTTVVSESLANNEQCLLDPQNSGEQCQYDYIRVQPLDIVVSDGGDVRVFYAYAHHLGTLEADCGPGGFCEWAPLSDRSVHELRIAWPEGSGFDYATLMSDRMVSRVKSVVDVNGEIHVAAYEGRNDRTVHYLRIGEGA